MNYITEIIITLLNQIYKKRYLCEYQNLWCQKSEESETLRSINPYNIGNNFINNKYIQKRESESLVMPLTTF